jgi:hypothetical protein
VPADLGNGATDRVRVLENHHSLGGDALTQELGLLTTTASLVTPSPNALTYLYSSKRSI